MAFSQFEHEAPPYRDANLMIDVLELHQIVRAADGEAFDEHFGDMLSEANDETAGQRPRLLARIEERHSGPTRYHPRPAHRFIHSFALARSLSLLSKDEFVSFLMGPSGFQLREARYPGWVGPDVLPDAVIETFGRRHCVTLQALWDSALIDELARLVNDAPFAALHHESLGRDYSMRFAPLQALFHILTSDQRFREMLGTLCGLKRSVLTRFSGRIYQMLPYRDADHWHNDVHVTDHRLLALSLFLEAPKPRGGSLVMRRAGFRRDFHREPALDRGGLCVFRIGDALEHKVARVWNGRRTNFAGWYLAAPSYPYRRAWLERSCFDSGAPSRWRRLVART
ncbi:MAG: 2OG-Fe(II) oxygenase [Myxococcota bacterium]